MRLIKISPKYQITIPLSDHDLCRSGWFSYTTENSVITLRPVDIKEAKTDQEIIEGLLNGSI
ncbi:MAG: hypothetical protein WC806_05775 [Candidatus Gracilibacteria bacterium]|jgi:hypothetical protein